MKFTDYKEAISYIQEHNIPQSIVFDTNTGYDLAKWIVTSDIDDKYKIPKNFSYEIASSNLEEKKSIEEFLNSYLKYKLDNSRKSSKKVIFNPDDFSYNLFYSTKANSELYMDDIIYRYLLYPTYQNIKKLVQLYEKENVLRVLNNIRLTDNANTYDEVMKVSNPLLNKD